MSRDPALVDPHSKYAASYLRYLDEIPLHHGIHAMFGDAKIRADFAWFVRAIHDCRDPAKVKNYGPDWVAFTLLWLVEGDEYLGRISIRHELTPLLASIGGHIGYDVRPSRRLQGHGRRCLELALPIARGLGLAKVLITCDRDNLGSRKIIESCGGVFESELSEGLSAPKRRYWLSL